MLDILLMDLMIVFGVDLSGFLDFLSEKVWDWLYPGLPYDGWRIPLFGCSTCSCFWSSLLFLIITGQLSWLMLAYSSFLSFLTPAMASLLILIKDWLITIINWVQPKN